MSNASSGAIVLSAINRIYSSVLSQSTSGIIAYGSRGNIVFVDFRTTPPIVLDTKLMKEAHAGKVISVSFSKCDNAELLASISEDCQLKVWDLETHTCLHTLQVRATTQHVAWIYGNTNTLLYSHDSKTIAKLNVKTGNIKKIKLCCDSPIVAIVPNEKLPELVAVSHANGFVSILDIVQETSFVLKTHSMEVTNVSWSLVSPDTLLSVSLDQTLRVWKLEDHAEPFWSFYFPSSRRKVEEKRKIRPLGLFHPKKPNVIICTTHRGELGEVSFMENEKPKFWQYSYYEFEYLKFPVKLLFLQNENNNLLCCDAYKVSIIDIDKHRIISQVPFSLGCVYNFAYSPVNPSLMAVSNSDGIIRAWNSEAESALNVASIYVHYKTKVMTVAWHPTEENIIAYGTDEGRVGIVDTDKRKVVGSYETHHTDVVYCIQWGPCKKSENDSSFYLYSCGGGIIYIHKLFDFKERALNFEDLAEWPSDDLSKQKVWSEISWKSDYSGFCLGTFKGFVDVFNSKFVFLARFDIQIKTVEALKWHPDRTFMSPNGSSLKFWIACSGNDEFINIIDTSKLFVKEGEQNVDKEPLKKLLGHKKRVVDHCWSHHNDGFLASASKDSTAVVWNVSTGTIIATYLAHRDIVYGVHWSLYDKDIVYSGGQDCFLRMWKISEQGVSAIPDKVKFRKKLKTVKRSPSSIKSVNDSSTENNSELAVENDENVETVVHEEDKSKEISLLEDKDMSVTSNQCFRVKKDNPIVAFYKHPSLLFPELSTTKVGNSQNVTDCERLADILNEETFISDSDIAKVGPFTNQSTANMMLQIQGETFKTYNDTPSFTQVHIMGLNIKPLLQHAAANNSLTSYLVSMAPKVSHNFWLEMCEKFAKQLIGENLHYYASSYFMMCDKIYDAINALAVKNVIDALVLAKAHLPESDPVIFELLVKAKRAYASIGNKVGEAKCSLALNEPLIAAKTLASCPDPNYSRVAAYICRKFNLENDAEEFSFLCLEKIIRSCNWSPFESLCVQEPKMLVYGSFVAIHKAFYTQLQSLKNKDDVIVKYIFHPDNSENAVKIWSGNTCSDANVSFIKHMYHHFVSVEQSDLREMLDMLKALHERLRMSTSNAHCDIAIYITEFIIWCHLEESVLASQAFVKIFEAAYNNKVFPKVVNFLLLPMSLYWNKSTNTFNCKTIVSEDMENDLHIYKTTCKYLIDEISHFQYQSIKSVTILKEELSLDVEYVTNRVCNILSTKRLEDCVLSYFSASILDKLAESISKNVPDLTCFSKSNKATAFFEAEVSEIVLENSLKEKDSVNKCLESTVGSDKVSEIALQNDITDENSVEKDNCGDNNKSETVNEMFEVVEGDALRELIELALKEAEEKASSIIENYSVEQKLPEITKDGVSVNFEKILEECAQDIENCATANDNDKGPFESSNRHTQCLKNIEIFCTLVSFITLNICKDEYALLYYLKRRMDSINTEMASEVLSKLSKENKMDFIVNKYHTSLKYNNEIKDDFKEEDSELKVSKETEILDQNMNENVINDSVDSKIDAAKSDLSIENSAEKLDLSDSNQSMTKASESLGNENHNLHEDNASHMDENEQPKENAQLMNTGNVNTGLLPTENGFTNENLSIKLAVLTELLSRLENKTQVCYPDPFDAIPKILQILYRVHCSSECSNVKDKLHEFIHDLLSWSNKFLSTELQLTCQSCLK